MAMKTLAKVLNWLDKGLSFPRRGVSSLAGPMFSPKCHRLGLSRNQIDRNKIRWMNESGIRSLLVTTLIQSSIKSSLPLHRSFNFGIISLSSFWDITFYVGREMARISCLLSWSSTTYSFISVISLFLLLFVILLMPNLSSLRLLPALFWVLSYSSSRIYLLCNIDLTCDGLEHQTKKLLRWYTKTRWWYIGWYDR